MSTAFLAVSDVVKRFGGEAALDRVSLSLPKGAYTVLLGPSGSGKTTLLNVIGGFLVPEEGTVVIDQEDMSGLPPARRPTTTVFQDYALFPHMTVGSNVGFGLRMRGMPGPERHAKARAALRLVGLEDAFDRKPHQLSGGQRQRVALARALVVEPKVLLLDEPLGALDLKLRRQMQDELKLLQKRVGTTFVHVTHDQEEAMALADTLVVMSKGRVEDIGPPERVYARPATAFTAGFMGEVTSIAGRVLDPDHISTQLGVLPLATPHRSGTPVLIAVRPEGLTIANSDAGTLPLGELRIREVVFQGASKRVLGEIGPATTPVAAIVRVAAETPVAIGSLLPLAARSDAILVYADEPSR
jgi:spermidine/putrescine transport system ATP-binding protein